MEYLRLICGFLVVGRRVCIASRKIKTHDTLYDELFVTRCPNVWDVFQKLVV